MFAPTRRVARVLPSGGGELAAAHAPEERLDAHGGQALERT